jgi:putative peptidoglycan lipid II flippase
VTVAAGAFLASLLGVAKAMLVAQLFGIDVPLDAYTAAVILPTVLTGIVFGAFQIAVIPVLVEWRVRHGEDETTRLFRSVLGLALLLLTAVSGLLMAVPEAAVSLVAPGFRDERFGLAVSLLRIVAPSIVFRGASELVSGVFHTQKRFAVPALSVSIGVAVSLGYLVAFRSQGVHALAFGLLVGSAAQWGYTMVMAVRAGIPVVPRFDLSHPGLRRTISILAPAVLSLCLSHANVTVDQMMASTLPQGSVAALSYAVWVHDVVMQLFVASIGVAIFPFFAQYAAEGRVDELKQSLSRSIRVAAFVLLPGTALIAALGQPLVRVLFERGAFDVRAAEAVSGAWVALSLGLFFFAVNLFTARALTALGRMRALVGVTFVSVFLNVGLNAVLMRPLRHVGIAFSTSLTALLCTVLLGFVLTRHVGTIRLEPIFRALARTSLCAALAAGSARLAWVGLPAAGGWAVVPAAILGCLTYLGAAWLWNLEEWRIIWEARIRGAASQAEGNRPSARGRRAGIFGDSRQEPPS